MSVEAVLQRVALLEQARTDPALLLAAARAAQAAPAAQAPAEPAGAPSGTSFADVLQGATGSGAVPEAAESPQTAVGASAQPLSGYGSSAALGTLPVGYSTATSGVTGPAAIGPSAAGASGEAPGTRMVAIAESQIGQAEQPLGSNESPAIAEYRSATAGAIPGAPWCAYFASWVARQAGTPIGPQGEGLGSVSEIWSWAQSSGRAIPNGPGVVPQPGDLIVFGGEHVGIVKDVLPNGDIQTIEGNYENKVALNVRTPTEATGYVNMS